MLIYFVYFLSMWAVCWFTGYIQGFIQDFFRGVSVKTDFFCLQGD